jgi:hypothetical protein
LSDGTKVLAGQVNDLISAMAQAMMTTAPMKPAFLGVAA